MGRFVKPLGASVAFALVFVAFVNAALAREVKRSGADCVQIEGQYFLNGKRVEKCNAPQVRKQEAHMGSGFSKICAEKGTNYSYAIRKGEKVIHAVCR